MELFKIPLFKVNMPKGISIDHILKSGFIGQGKYVDEFGARCRSQARKEGWILKRNGEALCPKCSGKKVLTPSKE